MIQLFNRRKINQLLKTDYDIEQMIQFIEGNRLQFPEGTINPERYLAKSELFVTGNNNTLMFQTDTEPMEYVKNEDKEDRLTALYNNQAKSLGQNIKNFYYTVCKNYFHISRGEVEMFLKQKPLFNLSRPKKRPLPYSMPTYNSPLQMLQIDLIDMERFKGNNNQHRYIINIIDCFSKKIWLSSSIVKSAAVITAAFQEKIIDNGFRPKAVTSDNGTEFQANFSDLLVANNIKQILNPSYTPCKIVEASNRNVRKVIKDYFIRNRTLKWKTGLQLIENAINETRNGTTGYTPNDLFNQEDKTKDNPLYQEVTEAVKGQKEGRQTLKQQEIFLENQPVRIALYDAHSDIRKANKEHDLKNITYLWSPDRYYINKVYEARNDNGPIRYSIRDAENRILRTKQGQIFKLKSSSILDASDETTNANLTFLQAMTYNNIERPPPLNFV